MMRAYIPFTAILLAEILLLFLGCQGGNHNPIIPGPDGNGSKIIADGPGTEVKTGNGEIANTPVIWGLYQATYDPNTHNIETIPLRGACYAWNLVHFMQPPAGKANSMIIGVLDDSDFYSNGRIDIRVILHHPFPGQDIYTGFDVMGVFLTEGSLTCPANENIRYADPAKDPTVLNPDGYTRWMNPAEFLTGNVFGYDPGIYGTSESSENSGFVMGATYNPYKYFALGLGPDENLASWLEDPDNIANRGIFPSGATCSRDYEMNFPKVNNKLVFKFNYAIIANWAEPTVDPPDDPIIDFPPKANAEYPLHIFVNDNSKVYYTGDSAGGTLAFDIAIFDWDALSSPQGIPGEVSKIKIWSNDPLVPGGSIDVLSEEVEWNSGFTASLSTGSVEIPNAVPEKDGYTDVWFSIESTNPEYYDQGFGAEVPSDPIATNIMIPVEVKNCPKAFLIDMETNEASEGTVLNDVQITGKDFVDGADLSIWLESLNLPDSAGEPIEQIFATDVQYYNESTVTADFDLTEAKLGSYGIGCKNGCGVETSPEENEKMFTDPMEFKVIHPEPIGLKLSTNRSTLTAATIDALYVMWDLVEAAQYYNVYTIGFDLAGNKVLSCKIGTTTNLYYMIPINFVNIPSGMLEVFVTAASDYGNLYLESFPSKHGRFYYQRFENGLGTWQSIAENPYTLKFDLTTSGANYSGYYGIRNLGGVPSYPPLWAILASPPIPDYEGATTVKYEFLHKNKKIADCNGYQVGWLDTLPKVEEYVVETYHPASVTGYGKSYNDSSSTALQQEFKLDLAKTVNFRDQVDTYVWYLSGFDVSGMLGDKIDNYIVIGFAGNYSNNFYFGIDDIAILIY